MKQNSTPISDFANTSIETLKVNKANLSEEEYKLLHSLVMKSCSNFKQDVPKILAPIHGYDPFNTTFFTVPMQPNKGGGISITQQYYKANLLHDSASDAREAFDKRYVLGKLNYLSRNSAEPYNPWDGQHKHFFIAYKPEDDSLIVSSTTVLKTGIPYFASLEAANEAILIVGANQLKEALSSKL
jgi:hypothetical protein